MQKDMNAFFRRKTTKEKNIATRVGRRRGGYLWLVKVRDDMNPLLGNPHLDVFGFLGMAEGNPSGGILKSTDGADTPEDESHHAADEVAVAPAGGLESGPEVAVQTSFTRLAVIEKKAVGACHSIVVKVVNEGDFKFKSDLIDGGRQARKDVVNLPKIKIANLLVASQSLSNRKVVESAERNGDLVHAISSEKLISGADEVLGGVILLEGIADAENRSLLPTVLNIAAEDLENTEAAHAVSLWWLSWRRKKKQTLLRS